MLVAGFAISFTSCDDNQNSNNESTTHSQTFTLGEETFDIDNAISVLNIQDEESTDVYNTIILSEGSLTGDSGEGEGVIILFKGDILAGTYNLSNEEASYPKYFVTEVSFEDIVNFDIDDFEANGDIFMAYTGALTIEENDGRYVITTDGIEVRNFELEPTVATSSVDYEGGTRVFELATVAEESTLNGSPILTAGRTNYTYQQISALDLIVFFSEDGKMYGIVSLSSLGTEIPEGVLPLNLTCQLMYIDLTTVEEINEEVIFDSMTTDGTVNIAKEGIYYIVDIVSGDNEMHYKGTIPHFDFIF